MVMRRAKIRKKLSSARHYDQIRFRFYTACYIWMFLIVLIAWLLKISTPKLMPDGTPGHFAHSFQEWATGAAIGPISGWAVVLAVAAFYCWIIYSALRRDAEGGELSIGDVHV